MSRRLIVAATFALTLVAGSSGSALGRLAAVDYTLTSFDTFTRTLTGTTALTGVAACDAVASPTDPYVPCGFSATIAVDTRFLSAMFLPTDPYSPSDPYSPGDPYSPACLTLAMSYDTIVVSTDTSIIDSLLFNMATAGCNARVVVNPRTNTVWSFQPVP